MKNQQLYQEVKRLVKQRNQIPPQNPSSAHRYCQQQLTRKKLNPYDPRQKMNYLMKNFQQLETYVDVKALFECIHEQIKVKEDETRMKMKTTTRLTPNQERNQFLHGFSNIKQKIRLRLGKQFSQKYQQDNSKMTQIINSMQRQKQTPDILKNNNFSQPFQRYLQKDKNNQVDYQLFKNLDLQHSSLVNYIQVPTKSAPFKGIEERKKYADLIHQVSTYLQIILQTQFKKKWDQSTSKQTAINNGVRVEKKDEFDTTNWLKERKKIKKVKNKIEKNKENLSVKRDIIKTQFSNVFSVTKRGANNLKNLQSQRNFENKVFQTFTFRNRNIKQSLMNKVKKFISNVQDEQRIFKNDNKAYLSEIIKYQNILKNDSTKDDFLYDDQGIKEIRIRALEFK